MGAVGKGFEDCADPDGIPRWSLDRCWAAHHASRNMERVAHSLQRTAIERVSEPEDFDLFGRSAFNRYYYAVFLIVRDLLLEFNPNWAAGHADVPDILNGTVFTEINKFRQSAMRRGEQEIIPICQSGASAAKSLAELMKRANAARIIADYNPNIPIIRVEGERFSLSTTSINDAHGWPNLTRTYTASIRRAWRLARGI